MDTHKHGRVEEIIRTLTGQFLARESETKSLITVTKVEISDFGDMAYIFVTVFPEKEETKTLTSLKRLRSDLRLFIREHSKVMRIPTFDFDIDRGEKNRQRVDELSIKN